MPAKFKRSCEAIFGKVLVGTVAPLQEVTQKDRQHELEQVVIGTVWNDKVRASVTPTKSKVKCTLDHHSVKALGNDRLGVELGRIAPCSGLRSVIPVDG